MCERCGAEGPWAVKREDATVLWNQAHEPVKEWTSGFAKYLRIGPKEWKPVRPARI